MEKETFDIKLACDAQAKFIKEKSYPYFAPSDGRCYNCRRNIYGQITSEDGKYTSGYSVERASTSLITGCPHCHYSYCE
uniref:Uncharacterized protein n=1 Tax=viral metagenome TaxID=1070528 RepID=A0A6M3L165_9ZZZZ